MNIRIVRAIAKKDIRSITSNPQVWLGLVLLPLLFGIVLPAIVIIVAKSMSGSPDQSIVHLLTKLIDSFPDEAVKQSLLMMPDFAHRIIYLFVNYLLCTFFLLIPVINALMIAINSFVGEKERRTLESLLYAPLEIKDLFLGKVMAAFIPSYAITLIGFMLCGVTVNALTYSMFDRIIFPNWQWAVLLVWVIPAFTLLTILVSVFVSARTKGFQEAQQIGGIIILPIIALIITQVTGVVLISTFVLWLVGGGIFILSAILLRQIAKSNQREVLFERQVH